jgi:hypothetical protein
VKALAESLPPCLVNLKLSFEGCVRITDVSLQALTARLVQLKLKHLHLDFVGCKNLTDAGSGTLGLGDPFDPFEGECQPIYSVIWALCIAL